MPVVSAGILVYCFRNGVLNVLLAHPGGPFWANKDYGSWSIPKGLAEKGEDLLDAAKREFEEETGLSVSGDFVKLTSARQKSGKIIEPWAVEADCDTSQTRSNTFSMEWPPHSGTVQRFPEIDQVSWFDMKEAMNRIAPGQRCILEELDHLVSKETC